MVYLRRGKSAERRELVNEDEIAERLLQVGASVLQMEETPTESIIEYLLGAEVVIGVEGSQLCHAVHTLREGGAIVVIQPPFRFYNAHKDWADALGMKYGFVVGDPAENGFELDPDDLLRTIDLAIGEKLGR